MRKTSRYIALIILLSSSSLVAQNQPGQVSYELLKAKAAITIDGVLDEPEWSEANRGSGFFQTYPTDDSPAEDSTQFMITYTDEMIYVGVICYDYLPGKPITSTLKRDFDWRRNDNISFYIDPYNDLSNGFAFQVSADNVQREGLVILGGDVRDDWDNKWYSEVSRGVDYWSVEMAIPFKSFRYNSIPEWNIQFIRNNQKRNEQSAWIQVPQRLRASDMVYTGKLKWDNLPPETGTNVSFIPYVTANTGRDFEAKESAVQNADTGFDAKIGVTNSLNLDLTFNPDFSQVEVDQQVTDLQRFEIFFPEKRQFFLENQDLFAQNGFPRSRSFFSRRLGIQGQGSTQRNVPILGGARLSGKLGEKWRLGLMNMVTKKDATAENIAPAQTYSVAVLERQIFARSRISATFVGRNNLGRSASTYDPQVLEDTGELRDLKGNELKASDTLFTLSEYNYVYGMDYNLATVDNRWRGSVYWHGSSDPVKQSDSQSSGVFISYQTSDINWRAFSTTVGDGYNAEVGFVPRKGITTYGTDADYNFYTDGAIQRHGPSLGFRGVVDREWNQLDKFISGGYSLNFLSSSQIQVDVRWQSVRLQDGFDPSGTDGTQLDADTEYGYTTTQLSYNSDNRKIFNYRSFVSTGTYFNGKRSSIGGGVNYRFQPILQLGLEFEYNNIKLPDPFNDADLLLLSSRIDLTLTNKIFFTSFLQYNAQDNNFGQNHRFQWRFKPVSDLFIVYTDNYLTSPDFQIRNKALVVKLSYWLNL